MTKFLATFTNADTGMQARIATLGKKFSVSFWDIDCNACVCAGRVFADQESAFKCAAHWAGVGID